MSKFAAGMGLAMLAVLFARSLAERGNEASGWRPLFNGRDVAGWHHLGGGRCTVQDGQLVLEHDTARRPGYLVSTTTARDFVARFRCRVEQGDSGFFFRSQRHPRTPTEIMGPQVQLNNDPGRGLGGLFELHGRGWLCKPPRALETELRRATELIGEVAAEGPRVRVVLNGRTTAEWKDHNPVAGGFALQIHGGGFCKVVFEEMAVRIMDEDETKPQMSASERGFGD